MKESYSVYKHTMPNGKIYIGITKQLPEERWHNGAGYKDNATFWKDIILFGWANIKHEILFVGLSEEEAKKKEAALIEEYKSNDLNFGYNIQLNKGEPIKRKREAPTNKNLLMAKMVEYGDTDCVNALARLLLVSRTTASNKLNGYAEFDQTEIGIIVHHYNLSSEDMVKIFIYEGD